MLSARLTPSQALPKIQQYCAYQERCHSEVKDKLYGFGLNTTEVETIVSKLIEGNYLNEQRFAELYAGSKFRMNEWGRVKIKYHLKQKQVSDYCIKQALKVIDEDQYEETLFKLAEKKWDTLRSTKNQHVKKGKVIEYLKGKGYEMDRILGVKGVW